MNDGSAAARRELRVELLAVALALAPALYFAPAIVREMPISHDHPTHLFKAWNFWTELVPSGRLRGWSPYWGFGFPSDELIPCGGELWVGLFRALTLGLLSWLRTYAVAFAALMLLKSYAAYRFGAHFFGRAAGVIAAWLTLLDPGAMLEGGWEWHTTWGVWPVTLAAALLQLTWVRLDRVLCFERSRDVLYAGLLAGAALLTHQIALVALALTVPLLFLDRKQRPEPARYTAYARALAAVTLGCALSAFFVVPFITHTGDTLDAGWLHEPLPVVFDRLLEGTTFQNFPLRQHQAGLLGILLALVLRGPGRIFCALSALACALLASDVLVRTLHLERALPSLVKLEVNRLLLVGKLFWFPLVGYALVTLVEFGRWLLARAGLGARTKAVALALACIIPLSSRELVDYVEAGLEAKVTGTSTVPDFADHQRLWEWTRERRQQSSQHYRIAYELWRGNHLPTLAPVFDRTPLYKSGTTATQIFQNLPRAPGDFELYEAMSVRYVVTLEQRREPALRFVARFGSLFLYEFLRYRPEPFSLTGPGGAKLLEFSPETIRVQLSSTGPDTRLKLHVASYSRWRAVQGGRELPIATVPVAAYRYPMLMEVGATDGELRFEYVRRPADWLGAALTLLALPAFFAALWLARERPLLVARAGRAVERNLAPARVVLLALGVSLAVAVALRTRTRRGTLPRDSIFQRVKASELSLAGAPCKKIEPLVFQCGAERVAAEVVSAAIWGVHLCMHAPRTGVFALETDVSLGSFIAGSYDSVTRQATGSIRVALDGTPLAEFPTEEPWLQHQFVQFDTRARRGQKARLSLQLDGSAVDCFDFRVLP